MCVVLLPTLLKFLSFAFCLSFFLIELSLLFILFLTEYIVICVSAVMTMYERIYLVFILNFECCVVEFFKILNVVLLSIYLRL